MHPCFLMVWLDLFLHPLNFLYKLVYGLQTFRGSFWDEDTKLVRLTRVLKPGRMCRWAASGLKCT